MEANICHSAPLVCVSLTPGGSGMSLGKGMLGGVSDSAGSVRPLEWLTARKQAAWRSHQAAVKGAANSASTATDSHSLRKDALLSAQEYILTVRNAHSMPKANRPQKPRPGGYWRQKDA